MELHRHVHEGDLPAVRRLLAGGADVNEPDSEPDKGCTPLMYAAESPWAGVDMLRLLVENGADVNAVTDPPPPMPPLDGDWLENLPEQSREMLLVTSSQEWSRRNDPVLYFAIQGGDLEKIDYLLEAGADLYYQRTGGYDVLIDAVYATLKLGHFDVIEFLLKRGAKVDGISRYGESAIKVTARFGHFGIVKQLLDAGADIEQLQWTPLMHATVFGSLEDVQGLLKKRPYAGDRDCHSRTAFLLAAQRGAPDKMEEFLQAGASLEERGLMEETALIIAATADNEALLTWLLEHGARMNATDAEGNTALMHACMRGSQNSVRLLLDAGADADIENKYDETAFQLVEDPEIISLMIATGGNWNDANDRLRRTLTGLPPRNNPQVSREIFMSGKKPRFGSSNPEVMDIPFWRAMVKSGMPAMDARMQYDDNILGDGSPVWCYDRFGKSFNMLPDGRMIEIGGEHEDFYDPDFCIYNDVVVFDGKGGFTIFGYPEEVFPPTDFHTATLVGSFLYIIGGLGYKGERQFGETPVYRLDTNTMVIQRLDTFGDKPGWLFKHRASLIAGKKIRISGGEKCTIVNNQEVIQENSKIYTLDLESSQWKMFSKEP